MCVKFSYNYFLRCIVVVFMMTFIGSNIIQFSIYSFAESSQSINPDSQLSGRLTDPDSNVNKASASTDKIGDSNALGFQSFPFETGGANLNSLSEKSDPLLNIESIIGILGILLTAILGVFSARYSGSSSVKSGSIGEQVTDSCQLQEASIPQDSVCESRRDVSVDLAGESRPNVGAESVGEKSLPASTNSAGSTDSSGSTDPSVTYAQDAEAFNRAILSLINEKRASKGLNPLSLSEELMDKADEKAKRATTENISEDNVHEFMELPYFENWGGWGVNITAQEAFEEWVLSEESSNGGHFQNAMAPGTTVMGVGADGQHMYQLFD